MDKITFLVQGSEADPYSVSFFKSGCNVTATCTCTAGQNGQYCKHRFNILGGKKENIVSNNISDVATVASWLPGSPLYDAIKLHVKEEEELERAKSRLSAAKKNLAKIMRPQP